MPPKELGSELLRSLEKLQQRILSRSPSLAKREMTNNSVSASASSAPAPSGCLVAVTGPVAPSGTSSTGCGGRSLSPGPRCFNSCSTTHVGGPATHGGSFSTSAGIQSLTSSPARSPETLSRSMQVCGIRNSLLQMASPIKLPQTLLVGQPWPASTASGPASAAGNSPVASAAGKVAASLAATVAAAPDTQLQSPVAKSFEPCNTAAASSQTYSASTLRHRASPRPTSVWTTSREAQTPNSKARPLRKSGNVNLAHRTSRNGGG